VAAAAAAISRSQKKFEPPEFWRRTGSHCLLAPITHASSRHTLFGLIVGIVSGNGAQIRQCRFSLGIFEV
jgi:hypothetical protein